MWVQVWPGLKSSITFYDMTTVSPKHVSNWLLQHNSTRQRWQTSSAASSQHKRPVSCIISKREIQSVQKVQCWAEVCAAPSHASSQRRPEWLKDTACKISNTGRTGRFFHLRENKTTWNRTRRQERLWLSVSGPAAHRLRAHLQYCQFTGLLYGPLTTCTQMPHKYRLMNGTLSLKQSLFVFHTLKMWIHWLADPQTKMKTSFPVTSESG